ncbi:unnamed protein product [Clonostachys byssicola]|uniref:Cytochrome b5 heme-binding domain-containing protein n=1 Tax=Clonostachys byssicola TaxID=160290 RepID=A0A9N9UH02_9HYPO|nr:unnamed protein product [Clonostachys byssicola]
MAQPLILSPEPQLPGVATAEKVAVEHFEHQIASPFSEKDGLILIETEGTVDNNLLSKDSMGMVDEVLENNESASENVAADVHKTLQKATENGEMSMPMNLPTYTMDEIAAHNTIADLWVVIDNDVYDMTEFQHKHPGGYKVMRAVAGKDATKKFNKHHRRAVLAPKRETLLIGTVNESGQLGQSQHKKGLLRRFGFGFGFGSS